MNPALRKRIARTVLFIVIGLLIGSQLGLFQTKKEAADAVRKENISSAIPGAEQIGGAFELIDQDGKAVTQDDYAGQYKLIYFGFTYCPAICPTELQKISRALGLLAPATSEKIQPLFITIDPERDTVQVMKDYVALFHPRLIGLTGSKEQIASVLKNYRVYASKVQTPEMNDYTMDHSSFIYLMSPKDELISIYRIEDGPDYIADDIQKHTGEGT